MLQTFLILELAFYALALSFTPLAYVWFSLALLLTGLHEIVKYILFGADSFLWAGGILSGAGVIGIVKHFANLSAFLIFPWYIFAVAFGSLLVFAFFRQFIHLKIFVILSLEVVLLLLFCYNIFELIPMVAINTIYITAVVIILFVRLRKNTKTSDR